MTAEQELMMVEEMTMPLYKRAIRWVKEHFAYSLFVAVIAAATINVAINWGMNQ